MFQFLIGRLRVGPESVRQMMIEEFQFLIGRLRVVLAPAVVVPVV